MGSIAPKGESVKASGQETPPGLGGPMVRPHCPPSRIMRLGWAAVNGRDGHRIAHFGFRTRLRFVPDML